MSAYKDVIESIDSTVNWRWVEGFMRNQYGTLSHLDRIDFEEEINLFKQTLEDFPNEEELWESNARSHGLFEEEAG